MLGWLITLIVILFVAGLAGYVLLQRRFPPEEPHGPYDPHAESRRESLR